MSAAGSSRGIAATTGLSLIVAVSFAVIPGAWGLDPTMGRAATVVAGALTLWATGVVPEPVTAVGFFLACILLGVAAPEAVFSGFSAGAFWLVFGGLVVGMSVKRSGLGERLARAMVGRIGRSYFALLVGVGMVAMCLAVLMPSSMGRVVLLLPVVLSLADGLGYGPGSRGRTGLILLVGMMGLNPPAAIFPAVVPNMVMAGSAGVLFDIQFQYLPWLYTHLPTTGLLKMAIIIGATWILFRQPRGEVSEVTEARPWSFDEKRLAVVLAVMVGLWVTDSVHGVSPAWVALGGALVCLLPPAPLVPMPVFNERFNFGSLLHLAALLALGVIVANSGLGSLVGDWLLGQLPFSEGRSGLNFAALSGLVALVGLVATIPGVPAVVTPLSGHLADITGLSLNTVLMTQVVGYTTVFLPYQVPPLIVAMTMGGVGMRPAARFTLLICALSVLLVWPLTWTWWRIIGLL